MRTLRFARRTALQFFAIAALTVFPFSSAVVAGGPKVSFDLGYVVECHDVTPQAFARVHPDERIVEANLRVSVRVDGEEKDVQQLQFEITSPAERLRVIDFMPQTQIEPEAADNIEIVKTSETIRSVGATVGTSVSLSGGNSRANGAAVFSSGLSGGQRQCHARNELKETTKKIPLAKAVVASGTLSNEHGVFFKLRHSAGVARASDGQDLGGGVPGAARRRREGSRGS